MKTIAQLNRRERRRLDRIADKLAAKLNGMPLPPHVDPERHVGFKADNRAPLVLVDRAVARDMLIALGAPRLLDDAEAQRAPMRLVVFLMVERWITAQYILVHSTPTVGAA